MRIRITRVQDIIVTAWRGENPPTLDDISDSYMNTVLDEQNMLHDSSDERLEYMTKDLVELRFDEVPETIQ